MATRTLSNERDRILTVLINPFMSCGARLPVYAVFATVFFPDNGGQLIFSLYAAGLLLAILTGLLLKHTILRGEVSTFVMELPPYHIPTLGGILHHTWNRLKSFLIKAGKIIMLAVVILTLAQSLRTDWTFNQDSPADSILSAAGKAVSPVFRPMGITEENWPAAVGLFTGIFAKEAVIGTLDSLYTQLETKEQPAHAESSVNEFVFWDGIRDAFRAIPAGFSGFWSSLGDPLGVRSATEESQNAPPGMAKYFGRRAAAVAYLLFVLIYAPCVAAIGATYRETNLRWTAFSVTYLTCLAWVVSTAFYQTVTFFEHPSRSAGWLAFILLFCVCTYGGLKIMSRRQRAA
jgi:ferrous iron transport protein B